MGTVAGIGKLVDNNIDMQLETDVRTSSSFSLRSFISS